MSAPEWTPVSETDKLPEFGRTVETSIRNEKGAYVMHSEICLMKRRAGGWEYYVTRRMVPPPLKPTHWRMPA